VWARVDVRFSNSNSDEPCFAVYVLLVPRYNPHPHKIRGWGTLRVSLHRANAKKIPLVGADEMAAAILLIAGFTGFGAERLFFAVADGFDAIARHSRLN
jgi:hypothetical protein